MEDPVPPAHDDPVALGRRGFVAVAAAGAALGASGALFGCHREGEAVALGDLTAGSVIDRWTIVAVHPVRMGAIPVVLETEAGARFQVDIMAPDPAVPGVAASDRHALFVANAGDGRRATDEEQGLGALALAEALRERERAGLELPPLWTMSERTQREPDGVFRVPLG